MIEPNSPVNPLAFVSGPRGSAPDSNPNRPARSDIELLDAYSQAVVHVVETISPSVISVTGRKSNSRGSGSGFIISPDGYAITNSHVIAEHSALVVETEDGHSTAIQVQCEEQPDFTLDDLLTVLIPEIDDGDGE